MKGARNEETNEEGDEGENKGRKLEGWEEETNGDRERKE
jgi:hypothetical protein